MIDGQNVVALIPARGGSKGLPRKNLLPLCGQPLVSWPIMAARSSMYVDKVLVSTDDSEIADRAVECGAEVPFMRPEQLAGDTATTISVLEHAIEFLAARGETFGYVVVLEPTSPLTTSVDVDRALEMLISQRKIADAIVGVSRVEATHPEFNVQISSEGLIKPYLPAGFSSARRRQDVSELYFFDGTLYISDTKVMLQKKSFYHDRTLPYPVPKWKSFEVDDLIDFICIEAIAGRRELLAHIFETPVTGGFSENKDQK